MSFWFLVVEVGVLCIVVFMRERERTLVRWIFDFGFCICCAAICDLDSSESQNNLPVVANVSSPLCYLAYKNC